MEFSAEYPFKLSEADVRKLCGPGNSARGDLLQRAGHVLSPRIVGSGLRSDVLGSWRKRYQVHAFPLDANPSFECSCGETVPCRHVAALLLHWVRARSSFVSVEEPAQLGKGEVDGLSAPGWKTPVEELAYFLEPMTMAELRAIARRRGVKTGVRSKAELVPLLAQALAAPDNVDRAIEGLGREDRRLLEVVYLLGAVGGVEFEAADRAYRALGGTSPEVDSANLEECGLAFSVYSHTEAEAVVWVPTSVGTRLPVLDLPVARAGWAKAGGHDAGARIGMVELLLMVAHKANRGDLEAHQPSPQQLRAQRYLPTGWTVDPKEPSSREPVNAYSAQNRVAVIPWNPIATPESIVAIASEFGIPAAAAGFALQLLAAEGDLAISSRVSVRQDRVQQLLEMEPAPRLARLCHAWFGLGNSIELDGIVGPTGPFQMYYRPYSYGYSYGDLQLLTPEVAEARCLVGRIVSMMPAGNWYDLDAFAAFVKQLYPALLVPSNQSPAHWRWRVVERGAPDAERDKQGAPDLGPLQGPVVKLMVNGPLCWLGLVDIASGPHGSTAFRVNPTAGILTGRQAEFGAAGERPKATVRPDLTVLVPPGVADARIYGFLGRAGDLVKVSPEGLTYRLTGDGAQALFDEGIAGPEFERLLAEVSAAALPSQVTAALERWWTGYGAVRLYDDLCLLQLGDDHLLNELLATASLGADIAHVFSPTLVAVRAGAADELIEKLTRLGYTPRIVEEG